MNVIVDAPNQKDPQYVENPLRYVQDSTSFEHLRNQAMHGVSGIAVDYETVYPNGNHRIDIPLTPSTLIFYAQADSIKRRALLTLRVTKQPNGALVLWYESGIEAGVTGGVGKGTTFSYELSLQGTNEQQTKTTTELDALIARLSDAVGVKRDSTDLHGHQLQDHGPIDPYIVDRSQRVFKVK